MFDVSEYASTISANFPVVFSKPEEYRPTPYTFRIPNNTCSSAYGHSLVRCPPFYVQLDHTLAVIWSLFSRQTTKKQLGVAQLQWALNFLQGVRNSKGKHPKDVAVCIDALEDALIKQYAAMVDTVKPQTSSMSLAEKFAKSSRWKCFRRSKKSKSSLSTSVDNSSTILGGANEPNLVTQKFPFSVTYAEMSKKRPNRLEQLFKAQSGVSMTGDDIQRQLDNLLDTKCSQENVVQCLKVWRNEQINKLQEELQTLHSIETFIGSLDKDYYFNLHVNTKQVGLLDAEKTRKRGNHHSSLLSVKRNSAHRRIRSR